MGKDRSVLLPYRSVKPDQPIYPGGDCGACCLSSILNIPHQSVYDLKGEVHPIRASEIIDMCENFDFLYNDAPPKMSRSSRFIFRQVNSFGFPGYKNALNWWDNMRRFLSKGYVGMSQVAHNRDGHITGQTDHWVLIVGFKETWTPIYSNEGGKFLGSSRNDIVVISCSATGGLYEEEKEEFLKFRGGYNTIYIKPKHNEPAI